MKKIAFLKKVCLGVGFPSQVSSSLRAASLVSTFRHRNTGKGDGEKNGARKSDDLFGLVFSQETLI